MIGWPPGRFPGRGFPQVGILPNIFDARERSGEAQGCRVMGENEVSHDCNTPGPLINRRDHPISFQTCLPKEEGRGNPYRQYFEG